MSHNFIAHVFVAALLFAANIIIFDGGGLYSAVLGTTVEVGGNLMASSGDYQADADRLAGLIPNVTAVVLNIVLYYLAAMIILWVFGRMAKK